MPNNTPIILIDGSSYLYRAFFACPPLTNAKGEPTGAIFGVINMIRSLINQYNPTHIAVVFDAKGGSFRNEIYSEYKATREAMPENLRPQIEPIHTILKAMGLPLLCIEGVEADDVIGTLARQAERENLDVLISTGDKDMAQLVSDKITLINTMNNAVLDPKGVMDKFGVPPEKIIDYLALRGDSSDNIPGVPGVGEKTAQSLLTEFTSVKDIYARLDDIEKLSIRGAKSLKQKLIDNQNQAELSYLLATIKTDVKLDFTNEQLLITDIDVNKLVELFAYYGFHRWQKELIAGTFLKQQKNGIVGESLSLLADQQHSVTAQKKETDYQCILTHEQLDDWVIKLTNSKQFAFDTETDNVDHVHAKLVGISLSVEPYQAAYIPLAHQYLGVPEQLPLTEVLAKLKPVLENPEIKKIAQNAKFDYSILANYGIKVSGIAFDTMLESYVLNSTERHDMDSMANRYLNHKTITYDELTKVDKKKVTIDAIEVEKTTQYAAEDADITLQLHEKLWPELEKDQKLTKLFTDIEMPLAIVLAEMERTGVLVDAKQLNDYSNELAKQLIEIEAQLQSLAGEKFNPASPKQIQAILFDKHNLPVLKKTPKGDPSTSEEVLSELANEYELPRMILFYRGLAKLKNTYTDKLPLMISPIDQRIHTNYNQIGTITGRLSSNDPNLQNIPVRNEEGRRIRQAFIAPKGCKIISADYSQIELRIMAHLSQDESLLNAFAHDKDIHRVTAGEILGKAESEVTNEERRRAKAVNFGLIYGMSAFGLSKQINIPRKEAQFYIDRYFERYPGVQQYMEQTRQLAAEQGYVETLSGRRLYLPKIRSTNGIEKRGAERAAINAPMQGTAADIIKTAMIKMSEWIKNQSEDNIKMVMQVHDELVFEVKDAFVEQYCTEIKKIMENCYQLSVPLKVDVGIGNNWDEAH
ncbi:DNA polymerase I [Gilliamella sp. B14448G11]|uniref:DNA polymerase I n=1 Tax=unclassified Gilliamella TaxID=2685620 RepID=UPI0018DDCFE8|nr:MULTISPECIES: DNA polymerase I [unclassified Gilliamella]MBI0028191.1 DNA polymerase I [Gilliamella sp. B14448G7]MBI0031189.1 DNA polymerase I [Gilliamella sp. B14384G15]MBI0034576.1 DNA polymerase I [Gilliamella sp. B14448G11]MBI0042072.1 DNA polymerase I [Gilliamella sp. B14448G12]MBI0058538.1 DNA polymerase I [Gilliamella sp. B14384G12]